MTSIKFCGRLGTVKNKESAFLMRAIKKMFKVVGAKFTEDAIKQENWYQKHEWSPQLRDKFKVWFVGAAKKDLRMSKNKAEKEFAWFDLAYGFRDKQT